MNVVPRDRNDDRDAALDRFEAAAQRSAPGAAQAAWNALEPHLSAFQRHRLREAWLLKDGVRRVCSLIRDSWRGA